MLKKYFTNYIWVLKPNGCTFNDAYREFQNLLDKIDPVTNRKITKEEVTLRYTEYLNHKEGLQDKFGIKADEKEIYSVKRWIQEDVWEQRFKFNAKPNPLRDNYLYGI